MLIHLLGWHCDNVVLRFLLLFSLNACRENAGREKRVVKISPLFL